MNDIFKDFTVDQIKELRRIEETIGGKHVYIRTLDEIEQAKKSLDTILPDDKKSYLPYVKNILIAYDYAKSHFTGQSMLDDIKAGKVSLDINCYPLIEGE